MSGPEPTSARWKRPPSGNSAHVDSAAIVDESGNAMVALWELNFGVRRGMQGTSENKGEALEDDISRKPN